MMPGTNSHGREPVHCSLLPALLDPEPLEAEVYLTDWLFVPRLPGGLGGQTHLPWSDPLRGSPRFSGACGKMLV